MSRSLHVRSSLTVWVSVVTLVLAVGALTARSEPLIRVRAMLPSPQEPEQTSVALEGYTPLVVVFDSPLFPHGQESTAGAALNPFKFTGSSVPGTVIWYDCFPLSPRFVP